MYHQIQMHLYHRQIFHNRLRLINHLRFDKNDLFFLSAGIVGLFNISYILIIEFEFKLIICKNPLLYPIAIINHFYQNDKKLRFHLLIIRSMYQIFLFES